MDKDQLYQWMETIRQHLPLGKWQALTLAGFSLGVMDGRFCTLSIVAEKLGVLGKADSVERRLQRWLGNERIEVAACQRAWMEWVVHSGAIEGPRVYLLVDETKLSDHMSVMLVGLAYHQRCIGLVWRSYAPRAWPDGQVTLIEGLLKQVQAVLPTDREVIVEADRGIGTSPDLVRAVRKLGWHYLFRVQGITHFQNADHPDGEIRQLVQRGGTPFGGAGQVFKADGWLDCHVRVIWDKPYDEPWCLISDLESLTGREYAQRNWQEQSFRDLKSGGWHWNDSQVWTPNHADRLLLVLLLAYALTLSLGLRVQTEPDLRTHVTRGHRRHWSLFRLGLRLVSAFQRLAEPLRFFLDLFQPPSVFRLAG